MAGVVLRGLSKEYSGGVRAVDSLDLEITDGEFFALLGPSGCGKTTLLRTIAGLETASEGSISIGERDVTTLPPGDRDVAMVFQDYALFPHMTVSENVAYPLRIRKVGKAERTAVAAEAGRSLALGDLLERRPGQLSGGQQQRAALARAVACRPSLFLFDEPLSNLDARLRLEARSFLKKLQRELGVTTVFVTHDQAEALALADRIAVMDAGRIRQLGTPKEVFRRPTSRFVASFIGSTPMNLIEGSIEGDQVAVGRFRLPTPEHARESGASGPVILGFRPEYARLAAATDGAGGIAGTVTIVEDLGTSSLVSVQDDDLTVQVVVPEGEEPEPGANVVVVPLTDRALLYRAEDGDLVA
jgi:multiple sugar transport system ATP-binding protein